MSVNNRIKNYIQTNGLKKVLLAKRMGIANQNLSRILNSNDLKVSQLIELSKHLDVSPTYFFDIGSVDSKELEQLEEENKLLKNQLNLIESNFKLLVKLHYKTKVEVINGWFSRKYKDDILAILLDEAKEEFEKGISLSSDVTEILKITYSTEQTSIIRECNLRISELLHGKEEIPENSEEINELITEVLTPSRKIGLDDATN